VLSDKPVPGRQLPQPGCASHQQQRKNHNNKPASRTRQHGVKRGHFLFRRRDRFTSLAFFRALAFFLRNQSAVSCLPTVRCFPSPGSRFGI